LRQDGSEEEREDGSGRIFFGEFCRNQPAHRDFRPRERGAVARNIESEQLARHPREVHAHEGAAEVKEEGVDVLEVDWRGFSGENHRESLPENGEIRFDSFDSWSTLSALQHSSTA
jgi:hypothetical protein